MRRGSYSAELKRLRAENDSQHGKIAKLTMELKQARADASDIREREVGTLSRQLETAEKSNEKMKTEVHASCASLYNITTTDAPMPSTAALSDHSLP